MKGSPVHRIKFYTSLSMTQTCLSQWRLLLGGFLQLGHDKLSAYTQCVLVTMVPNDSNDLQCGRKLFTCRLSAWTCQATESSCCKKFYAKIPSNARRILRLLVQLYTHFRQDCHSFLTSPFWLQRDDSIFNNSITQHPSSSVVQAFPPNLQKSLL